MQQTMEAMRYRGDMSSRMDYIPSGAAVVMGEVIDVGNIIGVCVTVEGIADGALGSLETEGVFRLIKDGTSGPAFIQGDEVYWDTANNLAVDAPGANIVFAGIADEAAGANQDFVNTVINKTPPQFAVGYAVTTTTTT